jgi:hypothetical protein
MFPAGTAGWGLLLLRVCAAGMLVRSSIPDASISVPIWQFVAAVILALALFFGALTPIICCVSALLQVSVLLGASESNPLHFVFTFCVTVSLFLLGPGAYSVDSRLFGRRLIVHSDSK